MWGFLLVRLDLLPKLEDLRVKCCNYLTGQDMRTWCLIEISGLGRPFEKHSNTFEVFRSKCFWEKNLFTLNNV